MLKTNQAMNSNEVWTRARGRRERGREEGEDGGWRMEDEERMEDRRWRQNLVLYAIFSWAANLWSKLKKTYLVKQSVFQSPIACSRSGSAPRL